MTRSSRRRIGGISRREFLRLVAVAGGTAALAACAPAGSSPEGTAQATPSVPPAPVADPTDTVRSTAPPAPTPTLEPTEAHDLYAEAPMLAERVAAGDLPPVAERLPATPVSAPALPAEWLTPEAGAYGGELRIAGQAAQFDDDAYLIQVEALLASPGALGDNAVPNILESFVANDAGTEFQLSLRAGLKWSDGKPVTTEDVRFAWEDVWNNAELTPDGPPAHYRAGGRPNGGPMQIDILDTLNFRAGFSGSYGGFPTALAIQDWRSYHELLKPSHYLQRYHARYANPGELEALAVKSGVDTWTELFHLMDGDSSAFMSEHALGMPTLSPWVLVDASEDGALFERNPYYFKVDLAGNQLPYFDTIRYSRVPTGEALAESHFAGEVDYASEAIVMPQLQLYRENSDAAHYVLKLGTFHQTSGVAFLNLTYDDPGWRSVVRDVRFRQALSHAIERNDFIETLYFGLAEPSQLNPYEYAPDLANQLLDEMAMGERDPEGWRMDPEGNAFSIDFECSADQYDMVPAARLYMFYWQSIGLRCTLQTTDRDVLQERARENAHKATVRFGHSPLWFCQEYAWGWWGPRWNEWWASGGDEGEEPPDAYKSFRSKVETIMAVTPDIGRTVVAPEVGQMLYENVWYIVPVANQKRPRIENRDLRNVITNEEAFSLAQTLAMEQVFYRTGSTGNGESSS